MFVGYVAIIVIVIILNVLEDGWVGIERIIKVLRRFRR